MDKSQKYNFERLNVQNDRYSIIPFNYMSKHEKENTLLTGIGIRTSMGIIYTILRLVVTIGEEERQIEMEMEFLPIYVKE